MWLALLTGDSLIFLLQFIVETVHVLCSYANLQKTMTLKDGGGHIFVEDVPQLRT